MANPQIENGYLKLANELQDAFIRFDFTKRQRRIIDFIIRLSYGCQKKAAYIPQLKYFSCCGIGKQDRRKELEKLEAAGVLIWDRGGCLFMLNKNYDEWQIKEKEQDEELLRDLIALQLNPDYERQEVRKKRTPDEKEVRKIRTNIIEGSQNTNSEVRKIRTNRFVKYELKRGSNPHARWAQPVPKDNTKDIYKDNIYKAAKNNTNPNKKQEQINKVYDFFEKNIKPAGLTPYHYERLHDWIDQTNPPLVLRILKHAAESTYSQGNGSLRFIGEIIKRCRKQGIETVKDFEAAMEAAQAQGPANGKGRTEKLPDWFHEQKEEQPQTQPQPQDLEAIRKRLEAKKQKRLQQQKKEAAT